MRALIVLGLLFPRQDDLDKVDLRVRPHSPGEALRTFRVEAGWRVELAAAEPEVADPVAAAFDEDGRLYVAGMGDYPYGVRPGQKPHGKVYLLEDTDGDGRFERSRVFVDLLPWPTGIACWQGGVFVLSAPDLWYFKDTDGDGRADVRRKALTGYSVGHAEELANTLRWGLDNRLYGASSGLGGDLAPPGGDPVRARGRDYRFDPATMRVETVSGNSRFGFDFDEWGNRFICNASNLASHPVLPEAYLARAPRLAVGSATDRIGKEDRVYPVSGPEPWKVARQKFWSRFVDTSPDMRAGRFPARELAPQGFVTGAAGLAVQGGNVFTGEPANNLVVRLALRPQGASFVAERPGPGKREFLASTDNWFRPVGFAHGPDGCLYVLDMYREIIEYYNAIPEDILKRTDATSGRDRGRIWRIVPEGFSRPVIPRLAKAPVDELAGALDHPDPWRRDTAQRLLYERRDLAAAVPLRRLARAGRPAGKVRALWSLEGLGALDDETLGAALADADERVREQALRLSERRAALRARVLALAKDPSVRVRFQCALSLSAIRGEDAIPALAAIARRDAADRWVRTAVLVGAGERATALFRALVGDEFAGANELLEGLLSQADAAALLAGDLPERWAVRAADAAGRAGMTLEGPRVEEWKRAAMDPSRPLEERVRAARVLGYARFESVSEVLEARLSPSEPPEVQRAAVEALSAQKDPRVSAVLLKAWRHFGPALRGAVLDALLRRDERVAALLEALETERVAPGHLDASRRQALLKHRDAKVRERAAKVLGGTSGGDRREIVERVLKEMKGLAGDAARGAEVYRKNCATCHEPAPNGATAGPPLGGTNKALDQLLVNIIDPNRDVQAAYFSYTVALRDGSALTGMVAEETATSVTLRRAGGEQDVVLRKDIATMTASTLSLMPEGLEKGIDAQQMADLVRFIQETKK